MKGNKELTVETVGGDEYVSWGLAFPIIKCLKKNLKKINYKEEISN